MKILFLDIDGVLNDMYPNNPNHRLIPDYGERERFWRQEKKAKNYINDKLKPFEEAMESVDKDYPYLRRINDIDAIMITWLNYICAKTDCRIVISSSWRGDLKNIPLYFAIKGFLYPDYVVGRTGHKSGNVQHEGLEKHVYSNRGLEIQEWLEVKGNDYDIKSFAILDDESFDIEWLYKDEFVQVKGLTKNYADKVIEILNKRVE